MPLCCPSAAPPDSRGLLVPGECCTCFRPSTVPGEAAELFSLSLLFNFGSAYRAAKLKFKEGFAVVSISSIPAAAARLRAARSSAPASWLLADVCLQLFQSKHGVSPKCTSSPPACRDPAAVGKCTQTVLLRCFFGPSQIFTCHFPLAADSSDSCHNRAAPRGG